MMTMIQERKAKMRKRVRKLLAAVVCVCTMCCVLSVSPAGMSEVQAAAGLFDPVFYSAAYPDVVQVLGTDPQVQFNHYQNYGRKEGRLPFAGATPGQAVSGIATAATPAAPAASAPVKKITLTQKDVENTSDVLFMSGMMKAQTGGSRSIKGYKPTLSVATAQLTAGTGFPVPIQNLANAKSIRKKMSDEEFIKSYEMAILITMQVAGTDKATQLTFISAVLRDYCDNYMVYSDTAPHYNDPYGYLVLRSASCAGAARTVGLCLNILGIPYEHVNENQWGHQWCRVNVDGVYWICDPYGLYVGPEPAPYAHPHV